MDKRESKGPVGKTLAVVYGAVAAFTAISIIVPIWMEKLEQRASRKR
ncbi:hypothetical protein KSC_051880 [Ktedonobacter sp. SOSP1-52]|nr:hypothetical protein [Ktedonobacter sp. SOSP1-52]GHO66296.1 hypothetical protein KSC_051880 [Ktedonobacter sp. SOSP1-52]